MCYIAASLHRREFRMSTTTIRLPEALKARIEALVAARTQARAAKDFAAADNIRSELTALNVEVMDSAAGATWRIKDKA